MPVASPAIAAIQFDITISELCPVKYAETMPATPKTVIPIIARSLSSKFMLKNPLRFVVNVKRSEFARTQRFVDLRCDARINQRRVIILGAKKLPAVY